MNKNGDLYGFLIQTKKVDEFQLFKKKLWTKKKKKILRTKFYSPKSSLIFLYKRLMNIKNNKHQPKNRKNF